MNNPPEREVQRAGESMSGLRESTSRLRELTSGLHGSTSRLHESTSRLHELTSGLQELTSVLGESAAPAFRKNRAKHWKDRSRIAPPPRLITGVSESNERSGQHKESRQVTGHSENGGTPMKHVSIGGLDVSRIGLGAMSMAGYYNIGAGSNDESIRTIHRALDLGVTLIDTAEIYGPYTNEELVGRAIKDRREQVVLATKFGLVSHTGGGPGTIDSSPANVRAAVEGSVLGP